MIFSPVSNSLHHPLAYIIIYPKVETITYVLIVYIVSCENKNVPNTFLTLKSWVLYLFWQWCLSKLQYIEFENMYHSSFSYDLKRRYVEKNCHLIQFVPRLFIKSLVGDKLDFYLLTIWLCHHTHWSGVKYFLGENSILIHR